MIQIKFLLLKEQIQVIKRYYTNWRFLLAETLFFFLYLFSNPYRMCRKFLQKRGADNIYVYGETPLTTLEHIVRSFSVAPKTRWLDLGSGRGRGCFWLSEVWGCQVRGVEWVPKFVSRASWVAQRIPSCRSEFFNISMQEADFSWCEVVYLCGTCMSDEEIESLLAPMESLPQGAQVITISEPLNHPSYELIQSIPVSFIWGKTDAYLHLKL